MEGEAQEDEEVEEEVDMEDKVEELDEEEMEGLLVGMWARQSQHWRSIAAMQFLALRMSAFEEVSNNCRCKRIFCWD